MTTRLPCGCWAACRPLRACCIQLRQAAAARQAVPAALLAAAPAAAGAMLQRPAAASTAELRAVCGTQAAS